MFNACAGRSAVLQNSSLEQTEGRSDSRPYRNPQAFFTQTCHISVSIGSDATAGCFIYRDFSAMEGASVEQVGNFLRVRDCSV